MKNLLIRSLLTAALTPALSAQAQPALGVLPKSEQTQYAQPTLNPSPSAQPSQSGPTLNTPMPTPSQPQVIPTAPAVAAKAFILMDADSGVVLAESNADERLPPASLTKLMTSYVLSYEIEQKHVHPEDLVMISENAWSQNPRFKGSSLMFIEVGKQVRLHDLHLGVVVSSGNESSVAVAEYLAGTEDAFAAVMNEHSKRLGMSNTHFVNSHGLHDPDHFSSARDLATLSRAILGFPAEYDLYKIKEFTYNSVRQINRNSLLYRDPSVDGLKTGHTTEAGYCLVASAKRDNQRLISVVLGADSISSRERETEKLLSWGFRYYETRPIYRANTELAKVRVWSGVKDEFPVGVGKDLTLTIPRGRADAVQATMNVDQYIKAPLTAQQTVGEVIVTLDGREVARTPLVALEDVDRGGIFKRFWDWMVLLFTKMLS
ncbi:MAG: D-alanyl-D-alanine carboxypeptidase family protein [Spongiibacteraceae bacterium]